MGWVWKNYRIEYTNKHGHQVFWKVFFAPSESVARKQFIRLFPKFKIQRVVVEK